MGTPPDGHRSVSKNGHDQIQDQKLRDLTQEMHEWKQEEIRVHAQIESSMSELRRFAEDVRVWMRSMDEKMTEGTAYGRLVRWLLPFFLTGLGWFMVLTLQHIWSGG